jgi:hypothetical protein
MTEFRRHTESDGMSIARVLAHMHAHLVSTGEPAVLAEMRKTVSEAVPSELDELKRKRMENRRETEEQRETAVA